MRKVAIAILIGSDSDLAQCREGLSYLADLETRELAEVVGVWTASIHRNTDEVLDGLADLAQREVVDVLIAGAGWANALTGTCDSYLRYSLDNDRIVVIGVAFEDKENPQHTQAAILSITEVPRNQVVFDDFVGAEGFLKACRFAVEGELPKIKLPEAKSVVRRSVREALEQASLAKSR